MAKAKKVEKVAQESNVPAVKEAPGAVAKYSGLMDAPETVDAKDLLLPKLLLMQGLSKLVAESKAVMGEIRESLGGAKIGDKATPAEVIPFHSFKTWIVFNVKGAKLEYAGTFPMTPENAAWEREIKDPKTGAVTVKRYATINYYVLLPSEIAKGEAFPHVVSFRSTSYTAGRKLETHKVKYQAIKRPICWKTFMLRSVYTENDNGKFYVYDVEPNRLTTDKELEEVAKWKKLIGQAAVKVDDSDLEDLAAEGGAVDVNAESAQY